MVATRITIETLASGQPRPYADTIRHVRVTFECRIFRLDDDWKPWDERTKEEVVRDWLNRLQCGFTEFVYPPKDREATTEDHYRTRLDWLKQVAPGVWEFHTTTAFTD